MTMNSYTCIEAKTFDIDYNIKYNHKRTSNAGIPYIRCYMLHTYWTCLPRSRSTHGSLLLLLRPSGVSVLLYDGLDALRRCPWSSAALRLPKKVL